MALTFPLSWASFASAFKIASATFWLPDDNQSYSGLATGQIRVKDLAPRLWRAQVETTPMLAAAAQDLQAQFESLDGAVNQFYLHNPRLKNPKSGAFTETSLAINSLVSDGSGMSLKGLPASYVVSRGDLLSFTYNTTHRAMHRVLETVTANGSGVSPTFSVAPVIRAGAVTNTAVNMNPATMLAIIIPGSFKPKAVDALYDAFTFEAMQTMP